MGEIAESLINGEFDFFTGEYIDGKSPGYPRIIGKDGKPRQYFMPESPSEKKIRAVRKELAILISEKHKSCTTQAEKNKAVIDARAEINQKYGKGWRERGLVVNSDNQWTEEELAPFKTNKNGKRKKI